jgi:hypothetical protein
VGCNCGKTKAQQSYEYTDPKGTKKVYRTEIEAKAAVIRSGGSYKTLTK